MSWAEVKKINSDLSEPLDTKISAVETKVDTVDTVVDTINTNVGSDADSASASGSVHAKLKDIRDNMGYTSLQQNGVEFNSLVGGTWYTIISHSGDGFACSCGGSASSFSDQEFRVTIDGNATIITNSDLTWHALFKGVASNTWVFDLFTNYKTQFKVEIRSTIPNSTYLRGFANYLI